MCQKALKWCVVHRNWNVKGLLLIYKTPTGRRGGTQEGYYYPSRRDYWQATFPPTLMYYAWKICQPKSGRSFKFLLFIFHCMNFVLNLRFHNFFFIIFTTLCSRDAGLFSAAKRPIFAWIKSNLGRRYPAGNWRPFSNGANCPVGEDPYAEIGFSSFWCAVPLKMPFCWPEKINWT